MSLDSWGQYANNLLGALTGNPEEFYDASGNRDASGNYWNYHINFEVVGLKFLLFFIVKLTILLLFLFGAARLSWCYNTFYGAPDAEKILWAILCFIFSPLYYPFYGLYLDPVCGRVAQRGGKK